MDFWRDWPYPVAVAMLFVVAFLRAGATYALGRAAQGGARRTRVAKLMARPGFTRTRSLAAYLGAGRGFRFLLTVDMTFPPWGCYADIFRLTGWPSKIILSSKTSADSEAGLGTSGS